MKNRIIKFCLLAAVLTVVTETADAQAKKPVRSSTKRTTTKKSTVNRTNNAANNAALAPKKDTVPAMPEASLKIEATKPSLRNDNAIQRNLVKDRTPLDYEHIREDDATYMQRIWRELDVKEKMNVPFAYKATGDNGDQRFIMILLSAIKSGEVTAFSAAGGDDRFTTPLLWKDIAELMVGKPKVQSMPDWANDPDGSKGLMKDTIISAEFNPDLVERLRDGAELNEPNPKTFYTPGPEGYTDYPALPEQRAA